MLTKIQDSYKKLIESKEFKHEGFFCGAFILCDLEDLDKSDWQIDFYNKNTDTITTYVVSTTIEVTDNSEVFKEENTRIEELKLNDIKVDLNDLKNKLQEILDTRQETPVKITIILQHIKIPMWNIIYITKKFNLLNIKIDARDGKVIEEKIVPLLSFEKGNK